MAKENKYFMKRRRYGWGFIPTSWQSWLFLALQLAVIFVAASFLPPKPAQPTMAEAVRFFSIVVLIVVSTIIASTMVGPKPHWRWGKRETDNPREDF